MSNKELDREAVERLEAALFAARDYVTPAPDLRPRTLEQARTANRAQRWANRLTLFTLGSMLLWSLLVPMLRELGAHRDRLTGPFPEEIEQAAQRYVDEHRYEAHWGMVEAFRDARQTRMSEAR